VLLATVLLLSSFPQAADAAKPAAGAASVPAVAATEADKDSAPAQPLPSAPAPKIKTDAESASAQLQAHSVSSDTNPAGAAGSEAIEPASPAFSFRPVKPALTRPHESRGERVTWYSLMFVGHSAAAFDAWSTRRAVSQHYGTESNMLLRPFSHSSAMYAATQVSPAFMDFLGKRMMTSQSRWVRRMWWLPQAAGSGFSVYAGVHNYNVVP
jgi:hypothetical protein